MSESQPKFSLGQHVLDIDRIDHATVIGIALNPTTQSYYYELYYDDLFAIWRRRRWVREYYVASIVEAAA